MRRSRARKFVILPDPKFGEVEVTRFVNNLMLDGKKSKALKIFYDSLEIIEEKNKESEESPLDTWRKAVVNVTPQVEVRSRRVGGANYQIPTPVRDDRKKSLGIKWLISSARKRNERNMAQRLANEIMAAAREEGAAFKKKEEVHRMAEANKAFSHFRI